MVSPIGLSILRHPRPGGPLVIPISGIDQRGPDQAILADWPGLRPRPGHMGYRPGLMPGARPGTAILYPGSGVEEPH